MMSQTVTCQGPTPDVLPRGKRALDLVLCGFGLIVLLPLFGLLALAVRLSGPGPVLFVQTRIGRNGRPFAMLKFRSMHSDAEDRRAGLLVQNDRAGLCFKHRNDPRVTRIGHLLRRTSLDELPQLWNVLRGEMSLIGPRPALPEEVAAYPARARARLAVLPGITGLWQVSGRANLGFDEMIALDLRYIREASMRQDLAILLRTVGVVLTGRGAY